MPAVAVPAPVVPLRVAEAVPAQPVVVKLPPVVPRAVVVEPDAQDWRGEVRRRRWAMIGWISFGVAFAAGCVIAAFWFQPKLMPAQVQAPVAVVAAEPVEIAAISGVDAVRLRLGAGFSVERRQEIVDGLREMGVSEVQVDDLAFAVASSRVGYYRAEDIEIAQSLAAAAAPLLGAGGPIAVRDYAQLVPDAEAGRLDLWVAD